VHDGARDDIVRAGLITRKFILEGPRVRLDKPDPFGPAVGPCVIASPLKTSPPTERKDDCVGSTTAPQGELDTKDLRDRCERKPEAKKQKEAQDEKLIASGCKGCYEVDEKSEADKEEAETSVELSRRPTIELPAQSEDAQSNLTRTQVRTTLVVERSPAVNNDEDR
jgi:hypothetical protein